MTKEDIDRWFAINTWIDAPFVIINTEDMFQAFKHRLMHECSLVERMTPEEFEEWKKAMVVDKR